MERRRLALCGTLGNMYQHITCLHVDGTIHFAFGFLYSEAGKFSC